MMFQIAFETMDSEAYGVVITGPERVHEFLSAGSGSVGVGLSSSCL